MLGDQVHVRRPGPGDQVHVSPQHHVSSQPMQVQYCYNNHVGIRRTWSTHRSSEEELGGVRRSEE